jgi:UDP-2,3-diacylglucosamine pyrophosphatase LpxH
LPDLKVFVWFYLAHSAAERSNLLRSYFEPTEEERERGTKLPTQAHKAIAELVDGGSICVIVTTNFDHLMEQALEEKGITPTVIATPDAAEGAMPLAHSRCTLIKVHGDYLDTRIKNTPRELEAYDERVDRLLDQVLDEYGLIICGWSGEWDKALIAALERSQSRRFTTYWAAHEGRLSDSAKRLVALRKAQVISIEGADHFFTRLSEKVLAL